MSAKNKRNKFASVKGVLVYKMQTLAAGGFRITIDGDRSQLIDALPLMVAADTPGMLFDLDFYEVKNEQEQHSNTRKLHI